MNQTYRQLKADFDKRVEDAQTACEHKVSMWVEHWWAIGHSSGYRVKLCKRCNKSLKEDPTKEERDKQNREWLKEHRSRLPNGKIPNEN